MELRPHTPLGELTASPQTTYMDFRGLTSEEKEGEEKGYTRGEERE